MRGQVDDGEGAEGEELACLEAEGDAVRALRSVASRVSGSVSHKTTRTDTTAPKHQLFREGGPKHTIGGRCYACPGSRCRADGRQAQGCNIAAYCTGGVRDHWRSRERAASSDLRAGEEGGGHMRNSIQSGRVRPKKGADEAGAAQNGTTAIISGDRMRDAASQTRGRRGVTGDCTVDGRSLPPQRRSKDTVGVIPLRRRTSPWRAVRRALGGGGGTHALRRRRSWRPAAAAS